MDRTDLKKKIYEACFKQLQTALENLKVNMDEVAESAEDYGMPKDMFDSYRDQLMHKREMYAEQYVKVKQQLDILRKIDPSKIFDTVKVGAVVITKNQKLFIATGIGKLIIDGTGYFVLSPKVPFYTVLENKKKGDAFEFREIKDEIIDVF
jgi:hypothetical protein